MEDEASDHGGEGGNVGNLTMEQLAQLICVSVDEERRHNRPLTLPATSSVRPPPPPPHEHLEAMWEESGE